MTIGVLQHQKKIVEDFAKENNLKILWDDEICVGDFYLAKKNTGFKLLTCKEVNKKECFLNCAEKEYPYDICDCVKVIAN